MFKYAQVWEQTQLFDQQLNNSKLDRPEKSELSAATKPVVSCLQIFWHLIMVINPQQGGREGKRDANGFINCTSCKTVHQTTQEFVVHCRSAEPSLPLNDLHFNNESGQASTLRTQSGRKSWQQEVQQT